MKISKEEYELYVDKQKKDDLEEETLYRRNPEAGVERSNFGVTST